MICLSSLESRSYLVSLSQFHDDDVVVFICDVKFWSIQYSLSRKSARIDHFMENATCTISNKCDDLFYATLEYILCHVVFVVFVSESRTLPLQASTKFL